MRENKHLEKELLFKSNIKDITSISLDSEFKIEDNKIIGNFIVDGEYKIHEVSINRESFSFKIPYLYEIESDIDSNSINVEISNFIYDYKEDLLIVNIDYIITGNRKEVLLFDNEESLDEFLSKREVEVIDTRIDDIKDNVEDSNNILDIDNDVRSDVDKDSLINNINNKDNTYSTFKVIKICENETIEGIVIKNKTTIDELKEYNDITNLSVGDKLIIPINE